MATTGIRFNVDVSQAQSQINSLNESLEELENRLRASNAAGDYSGAADITRQIEELRNTSVQNSVPQAPGITGSALAAGGDTQTLRQIDVRLELLNRTIQELTNQLDESTSNGQHRDAFNISATLNNAEEERQRLQNERERLRREQERRNDDNDGEDSVKKYGVVKYLGQGLGYMNQIAGIGFNYRTAMANGDYIGAGINALDSGSNIAQGLGGGLLGAGMMLGGTPVGWGLMAAGGLLEVGGAVGKYVAGDKNADKAEAEAYERTLATSNGLNKLFTNGGTWSSNAARTENILNNGRLYAKDTGMATLDFVNLATQYSRFGASSADDAMSQARLIANYANTTGADLNTIQNFLGTARRYGDDSDVLGYASQARKATGMTKAQTQEFLLALQGVIEDGISNGYVKSTEDVSKTLTMFARLSDNNPLWQGQQGANRLQQMNSGISSATGLQSVSDVIVATAANDVLSGKTTAEKYEMLGGRVTDTYIDSMLLMEQGTNPTMFSEIAKSIQQMEGDNKAAQIERYKDIFKLNYSGAVDVYNMAQTMLEGGLSEDKFGAEITRMQTDANYQSEETRKQNAINSLDENVRHIAQSKFWDTLDKLEGMVRKISNQPNSPTIEKAVDDVLADEEIDAAKKSKVVGAVNEADDLYGLTYAAENGSATDKAIAERETKAIMGAQLAELGESGLAAKAKWQAFEYGSFASEMGIPSTDPEMEKLAMNLIGDAASQFGDEDVADFEITSIFNELTNPKRTLKDGWNDLWTKGSPNKDALEERTATIKNAYENKDLVAFTNAVESAIRRAFNDNSISLNVNDYN